MQIIYQTQQFDISISKHRAKVLLCVAAMFRALLAMGKCWHANFIKAEDGMLENVWHHQDNGCHVMHSINKSGRRSVALLRLAAMTAYRTYALKVEPNLKTVGLIKPAPTVHAGMLKLHASQPM